MKRSWTILVLILTALFLLGSTPSEAPIDTATRELTLFNFRAAHSLFVSAIDREDKGSEPWQQAVYGAAVAAHHVSPPTADRISEAVRLYDLLIERAPRSKYAPRARLNLGRIAELSDYYRDPIDLPAAREHYQAVVKQWPDHAIAGEATLRLAATYVQSYETEQVHIGLNLLERWLSEHPDDRLAAIMWQYLGDTYFYPIEDFARSMDCYIKAEQLGLAGKGREGAVYWRMANIAERLLNDHKLAARYYARIIELVPASGKAYEAGLALKRLRTSKP